MQIKKIQIIIIVQKIEKLVLLNTLDQYYYKNEFEIFHIINIIFINDIYQINNSIFLQIVTD